MQQPLVQRIAATKCMFCSCYPGSCFLQEFSSFVLVRYTSTVHQGECVHQAAVLV